MAADGLHPIIDLATGKTTGSIPAIGLWSDDAVATDVHLNIVVVLAAADGVPTEIFLSQVRNTATDIIAFTIDSVVAS